MCMRCGPYLIRFASLQILEQLTSKEYAESIRSRITDNSTHDYHYYGSNFYDRDVTGTTHLSVHSRDAQLATTVAMSSTINY